MDIKYVCDFCGKAKQYSKKEKVKIFFARTIITILAMIGFLTIIFMLLIGTDRFIGNISVSTYLTREAIPTDHIREISINATADVPTGSRSNSFMYALELFDYLTDNETDRFKKYVPSSKYNLFQDLETTLLYSGDCKESSMLFVAMMKSLGLEADVDCNLEMEHCVAVIPDFNDYEKVSDDVLVVDMTVPAIFITNNKEVWGYLDTMRIIRW